MKRFTPTPPSPTTTRPRVRVDPSKKEGVNTKQSEEESPYSSVSALRFHVHMLLSTVV